MIKITKKKNVMVDDRFLWMAGRLLWLPGIALGRDSRPWCALGPFWALYFWYFFVFFCSGAGLSMTTEKWTKKKRKKMDKRKYLGS